MADKPPFKINRSALPPSVQTLFNPANCFARGRLTLENGKPVLAGKCQVVQFGKNHTGNDCMFVCQADFSEVSQRERSVLASFAFDHQGRVIDLYFGNSAATPAWITHVDDGTRASFGHLPPPPPPQLQPHQPNTLLSSQMNEINYDLQWNRKTMTEEALGELRRKKSSLRLALDKEAAEAKQATQATHAAALKAHAELLQTPRWGCTRVLKGPVDFMGCQRNAVDRWSSLVEGVLCVSCVQVHADFDQKLQMSPENAGKVKPYFEHVLLTGKSQYGSSGNEYHDGQGFENQFRNPGHNSFVVLESDGSVKTVETRTGYASHPTPVPPRLSVLNPETRKKFEVELRKGHESVLSEIPALKWLEMHPLVFPGGPIDSRFADIAFRWVHALSMQFEKPAMALPPAALARMMESSLSRQTGFKDSAKASTPEMFAPAMRKSIFAAMATHPGLVKPVVATSCKCTLTNHNPMCKNQFCPVRYARVQRFSFEWPRLLIDSGPPELVRLLSDQMVANQEEERTKKLAAEVAEAMRKEAAAKKAAEDDAKRDRKNDLARQATALRKEAAAARAPASLRGKRSAAPLGASAAPLGASAAPLGASAAPLGASAAPAPALGAVSRNRVSARKQASAAVAPAASRKRSAAQASAAQASAAQASAAQASAAQASAAQASAAVAPAPAPKSASKRSKQGGSRTRRRFRR